MIKKGLLWKIELVMMVLMPYVMALIFKWFGWETKNSLEAIIASIPVLLFYMAFFLTLESEMKKHNNVRGMKYIAFFIVVG